MNEPFVYTIYVRTTTKSLWAALTDGEMSAQYWSGFRIQSDWKAGSPLTVRNPGFMQGKGDIEGTVLACDPPRLLTYTFGNANDPFAEKRNGPSRVTYKLEQLDDVVKLSLIHENLIPQDLAENALTARGVNNGWPLIFCSLKSLLETGKALTYERLLEEFKK